MKYPMMGVLLISLYNLVQALRILFRVIIRLGNNRDFVKMSKRDLIGATVILMQAPGNEPSFIRYSITGLVLFCAAIFALAKA